MAASPLPGPQTTATAATAAAATAGPATGHSSIIFGVDAGVFVMNFKIISITVFL